MERVGGDCAFGDHRSGAPESGHYPLPGVAVLAIDLWSLRLLAGDRHDQVA